MSEENSVQELAIDFFNDLLPIAHDLMMAYKAQTPNMNLNQLLVAVSAGLTAYLSTIFNGGHPDQAYRAAISTGKSVSGAVKASKLAAIKIKDPEKRLYKVLSTATDLIKSAGVSVLPDLTSETRTNISDAIDDSIKAVTLLPKIPTSQKLRGSGSHFSSTSK